MLSAEASQKRNGDDSYGAEGGQEMVGVDGGGGFPGTDHPTEGSDFRTQCTRHACPLCSLSLSLQISLHEQRQSNVITALIHLSKQYEASVCSAVFHRPLQTRGGVYLHRQEKKLLLQRLCHSSLPPAQTCEGLKRRSETTAHLEK